MAFEIVRRLFASPGKTRSTRLTRSLLEACKRHRRAFLEQLEDRHLLAIDLVSVADPSFGAVSGNNSSNISSISADGRYVSFASFATNLVQGDTNGVADVFVRDMQTDVTTRVSTSSAGVQGLARSGTPSISSNGRYVAFESNANNLITGDTNPQDVFVKDLWNGATILVSSSSSGLQGNSNSDSPSISSDGRYVTFRSLASNLVAGDSNGFMDTFVKDLQTGTTTLVSTDSSGGQGFSGSSVGAAAISDDGRYIAFLSVATNLVAGDTNAVQDLFLKDLQTGVTTRISTNGAGVQANGTTWSAAMSGNGKYVAFVSSATNLVTGDTNGRQDVFLKDLQTGVTTRVSTGTAGVQANSDADSNPPSLSSDGRYLVFASFASNLVSGDTNLRLDAFLKDVQTDETIRLSTNDSAVQGNNNSTWPVISADARYVAFFSTATNLHPNDTSSTEDVFRASHLVPLSNGGTAADMIFNLPANASDAYLEDDGIPGNGISRLRSNNGTFATTTFTNPTGSLTINRGNVAENLTITALPDFTADLTIGSPAAPFNQIGLAGPFTLAPNKSLIGNAADAITLSNASSDISTSGTGAISLTTMQSITLASGSSVTTASGPIMLQANQAGTGSGQFVGVAVFGTISSTAGGAISVSGRGGGSGAVNLNGVTVNGGLITSSGAITVTGTSAADNGSPTVGVRVVGSNAKIAATGAGTVNVTGVSLATGPNGHGVMIDGTGAVSSDTGSLSITGTATTAGTSGNGVVILNVGAGNGVISAGGPITITGSSSVGGTVGIHLAGGAAGGKIANTGSRINLVADRMSLGSTATNDAISGAGTVTLRPNTAGRGIDLGSAIDTNAALEVSNTELGVISATTLKIGDATSGAITISQAINAAGTSTLHLLSGGAVTQTASITETALAIEATGPVTLDTQANEVDSLSLASTTSSVQYRDATGFTVTTVDGVAGISAGAGEGIGLFATSGNVTVVDTITSNDLYGPVGIDITLSGNGALLSLQSGVNLQTGTGGNVNLIADKVALLGTITALGQTVLLTPSGTGKSINLGSALDSTSNTLELSDTELDQITAGVLRIGNSSAGSITVSAAITHPTSSNFALTSGSSNILFINPGSLSTGGGTLTLTPGAAGNVQPISYGTDSTTSAASTVSFGAGADLAIAINGTSVDTEYHQLNVSGRVNLSGVDLVISASYTPAPGDSFTIVSNDGTDPVIGTFNGLSEGAIVSVNGVDKKITYVGGDGNDVVLTIVSPNTPPDISFSNAVDQDDGANNIAGWTITDASGIQSRTVLLRRLSNNAVVLTNTTNDTGSFDLNGLAPGNYQIEATATENGSEALSSSHSAAFQVLDDDDASPVIVLGGSSGTEMDDQTQVFTWSISDSSGISARQVSITRNGGNIFANQVDSGTFNFNNYGLGTYVITVTATDADGDRSGDSLNSSATRTVTVTDDDTIDPTITLGGSIGDETDDLPQFFTWGITDASGISARQVSITRNGGNIYANQIDSGSFNFDSFGTGTYVITVTATDDDNDQAGDTQSSSATRAVNVMAANRPPTNITLSGANVPENSPVGTAAGTLEAIDPDAGDSATYSLVPGVGSEGNSAFSIVGNVLQTAASFDYETRSSYSIRVRATDGGGQFIERAFTVTVAPVNEHSPVFTSNGGGATASVNVAENTTAVTTTTATDADLPAQSLTYTIVGGPDSTRFTVNLASGVLSFVAALDYETPADVGGNNAYDLVLQISDGAGGTDTQAIAVTVTPVNDNNPVITSNGGGGLALVNVAENDTAVTTITATDADLPAQSLTYSILAVSRDAAQFTVDAASGVLSFATAPDRETPTDFGGNNIYEVAVRVSDGAGRTDTQAFNVTVTAVNDNSPVITSNGGLPTANILVTEKTTNVTTVVATDADKPAQTLSYSIIGGLDKAKFTIGASTGILKFATAPVYSTPTDSNGDNVYVVDVKVSDGTKTDIQAISVTVRKAAITTPPRRPINGYLVGATAFLDANFNGTFDPGEPATDTGAAGEFQIGVPAEFDLNGNELLDDAEGQWVVFGGTDSSTGLPAVNTLIAPGSWSFVTPLTTLVSALVANHGLDAAQAMDRVNEAFGLPDVDLSTMNPIAQTLAGDPIAAQVFAAHARVQDTISQSLALFEGAGGAPAGVDLSTLLMAEFAALIAAPAATLDLSDAAVIGLILEDVESASGVPLADDVAAGSASVIAATNQLIDEIPLAATAAFLNQVAQVKITSQGPVAEELESAAAGDLDIAEVVEDNTGTALAAQVVAAALPPTLIVPDSVIAEATSASGAAVNFIVAATNLAGESVPVVLSHNTGALFALGTTTVTASATGNGLTTTATFIVTVVDTVGPELTLPQDVVVSANAPGGRNVTFDAPTAVDMVDANPVIVWDPVSGFFPLGTTTVTVTATDATGNMSTGTFLVLVLEPNEAPSIDDQAFSLPENSGLGAEVGAVVATDPDDDQILTFEVTGGTGATAFAIDQLSGAITVADATQLDFETTTNFTLEVTVTDEQGASDTANIVINLINLPSITGSVFIDANQDGLYSANEIGIDGVLIELRNQAGQPVLDKNNLPITATTSLGGLYLFEDLPPGAFQMHEIQPSGIADGPEVLGLLGGSTPANDTIAISLASTDATDYLFAELGQQVARGDAAGLGFWQNKQGQNLIRQGGAPLAAWLSANFANVFGSEFAVFTGGEVADFYKNELFKQQAKKVAGPAKVDAQFMAVALSAYFTNRSLAGQVAQSYGFNVTDTGLGAKIVNVGSKGAAFGVENQTSLTVFQLLQATDRLTGRNEMLLGFAYIYDMDGDGFIDTLEAAFRSQANETYSWITSQGGI